MRGVKKMMGRMSRLCPLPEMKTMKNLFGGASGSSSKYYRKTSSLGDNDNNAADQHVVDERRPLVMRHISVEGDDVPEDSHRVVFAKLIHHHQNRRVVVPIIVLLLVAATAWYYRYFLPLRVRESPTIVPIEEAKEYLIDVGDDKKIWFRTWGNAQQGVPILFVHGGPGQAVVDYYNGNKRFFEKEKLYVVEVDQRGTGSSQPSVRDDYRNMKLYQDISIDMIADDYEVVRTYLHIDQWVVWGGSYGSTVGLNYCMLYPNSCIALLLRGIYLDTKAELKEVYTKRAFETDTRKSAQFEILYQVAQAEAQRAGEPDLDPNDGRRLLELYERMITRGDRHAIWTWHAFENNLMEDDPNEQLNPNAIVESKFREAQSVAFFETRLWLHGTFEHPSRLLQRVDRIAKMPIWICQGWNDNVCPAQNALKLVDALKAADATRLRAYFLEANHEDTDPVMAACLKDIMKEFLDSYQA